MTELKFIRLPDVTATLGVGRSTIYDNIRAGTFVPPVSLGCKSSAWLHHEVQAVMQAIVAGVSVDERKALVRQLIAQRATYRGSQPMLASSPLVD